MKFFRRFREKRRVAAEQAQLIARWEKIKPIIEDAADRALESDIQAGKLTVSETFRKMGDEVEGMTDEQLGAFLSLLEAGVPDEFKASS
jgi:hypothetical protein